MQAWKPSSLFAASKIQQYGAVIPCLLDFCPNSKIIIGAFLLKAFWYKVNDIEKKYLKLKKSHNARCLRGGSRQHGQFHNLSGHCIL